MSEKIKEHEMVITCQILTSSGVHDLHDLPSIIFVIVENVPLKMINITY